VSDEQPAADRLARWWPAAAVLGAGIGYLLLRESGTSIDLRYRPALCAVGAVLVLARAYPPREQPMAPVVMTLLLSLWAGVAVGSIAGRDLDRLAKGHDSRLWSHYHYYLGAKYFSELGYDGLYEQTIAADQEGKRRLRFAPVIRDLATYEPLPTMYGARKRNDAWTDGRWQAFVDDVAYFTERIEPETFRRLLRDRGYNAPPAGGALYKVCALLPLSDGSLVFLGLLDPALVLLALLLVGRVFGPIRALVAGAWLCVFYGNEMHLIGGPLLHDYLVALLLMACAVHKDRPTLAGAALGYAAMVRVFPVLLLGGLAVWTVAAMRRDGAFPAFTAKFLRGLAGAVLVLGLLGCLSGRGVSGWTEWAGNIELHSEHHRFGDKRIGLQHVFTHDWGGLAWNDWRNKDHRRDTWPEQKLGAHGVALLLVLLWAAASWRAAAGERDPLDSIAFAMALVFVGIVLSRYYWSAAVLLMLVGGRERDGPREAWLSAGLLILVAVFYLAASYVSDSFGRYALANIALGGFLAAALGHRLLATRRPPASS